ncbi:hypothetical protein HK098_001833 [Nowakowskiella sp. JEL0407]|nr:hypothetical protein HK098_001833 [Nowakowskiella sp. JEL0407]
MSYNGGHRFSTQLIGSDYGLIMKDVVQTMKSSLRSSGVPSPGLRKSSSPRNISAALYKFDDELTTSTSNMVFVYWGKFISKDLYIYERNMSENIGISVLTCDKDFDEKCIGNVTIPYYRVDRITDLGTQTKVPVNYGTSFLDGSMIYGLNTAKNYLGDL